MCRLSGSSFASEANCDSLIRNQTASVAPAQPSTALVDVGRARAFGDVSLRASRLFQLCSFLRRLPISE
jgi:hypothetical protein